MNSSPAPTPASDPFAALRRYSDATPGDTREQTPRIPQAIKDKAHECARNYFISNNLGPTFSTYIPIYNQALARLLTEQESKS